MSMPRPPGLSERALRRALTAFAGVVGREWLLDSDLDRETYRDIYQPANETTHLPAAAIAPASTEEVQALLRLANEHRVPLWPISRGKNLGYGGSAPRLSGSVVLDLSRLRRILEVDARHGYCVVEPGVGFFDLYQHLQEQRIPLWLSVPANAWGSVIGNALDRGIGYTPYGENTAQLCGLEVALPDGTLVRTGMGAQQNSRTAQLFRYGFGPSWDQLFVQSNFGVVTRAGLWLMPEPEATLGLRFALPESTDIVWALELLRELRLRRVIDTSVTMGNYLRTATMRSQRAEWYQGSGPIPPDVEQQIMEKYQIGRWNFTINLFGYESVIQANARIIRDAFAAHYRGAPHESHWRRGEPLSQSAAGVPSLIFLQVINWWGGRGGHMGFSPILPIDGREAYAQFEATRRRYEEFGLDHFGGFTMGERYLTNVNQIIYNRDDADMTRRAHALFTTLVDDAARAGYAEYRTHLDYMDKVARGFDFNDHALLRLNEKLKDALDPNGILAPGKSGIWPHRYRGQDL
ncbi:MAG: FAD-binding oxidoreductase [Gammaproteobacteria bacterium]|nr:FAD-binding oxidoreductase [Gammaproteobacteria bacterium]